MARRNIMKLKSTANQVFGNFEKGPAYLLLPNEIRSIQTTVEGRIDNLPVEDWNKTLSKEPDPSKSEIMLKKDKSKESNTDIKSYKPPRFVFQNKQNRNLTPHWSNNNIRMMETESLPSSIEKEPDPYPSYNSNPTKLNKPTINEKSGPYIPPSFISTSPNLFKRRSDENCMVSVFDVKPPSLQSWAIEKNHRPPEWVNENIFEDENEVITNPTPPINQTKSKTILQSLQDQKKKPKETKREYIPEKPKKIVQSNMKMQEILPLRPTNFKQKQYHILTSQSDTHFNVAPSWNKNNISSTMVQQQFTQDPKGEKQENEINHNNKLILNKFKRNSIVNHNRRRSSDETNDESDSSKDYLRKPLKINANLQKSLSQDILYQGTKPKSDYLKRFQRFEEVSTQNNSKYKQLISRKDKSEKGNSFKITKINANATEDPETSHSTKSGNRSSTKRYTREFDADNLHNQNFQTKNRMKIPTKPANNDFGPYIPNTYSYIVDDLNNPMTYASENNEEQSSFFDIAEGTMVDFSEDEFPFYNYGTFGTQEAATFLSSW